METFLPDDNPGIVIKKKQIRAIINKSAIGSTIGNTSIAYISLGNLIIPNIFCMYTKAIPKKIPIKVPLPPIIRA